MHIKKNSQTKEPTDPTVCEYKWSVLPRHILFLYVNGVVHPKNCWKYTHPKAIQDEFVSSSEKIWRKVALHHLLTNVQWMGAVRMRDQTADKTSQ